MSFVDIKVLEYNISPEDPRLYDLAHVTHFVVYKLS
jgi:hypothetical protein